jgi:hypothetical protein
MTGLVNWIDADSGQLFAPASDELLSITLVTLVVSLPGSGVSEAGGCYLCTCCISSNYYCFNYYRLNYHCSHCRVWTAECVPVVTLPVVVHCRLSSVRYLSIVSLQQSAFNR